MFSSRLGLGLGLAKTSASIGVTLRYCEALTNTVEGYIAVRVRVRLALAKTSAEYAAIGYPVQLWTRLACTGGVPVPATSFFFQNTIYNN